MFIVISTFDDAFACAFSLTSVGIFDQLGRSVEPFDAVLHDGGSQTKAEMKLINPAIPVACSAILAAQKRRNIALAPK